MTNNLTEMSFLANLAVETNVKCIADQIRSIFGCTIGFLSVKYNMAGK